ncbi:MAG: class II aldolase/adducin family protein [Parasporobacterium sp.]|nr:class II aldolase/adducin family protein [Parasporobacterium sp.]
MMSVTDDKINEAIWIAKALFDRKMGTGTSGNISFVHDGRMYISGTGTCFGKLTENDFAEVSLSNGESIAGRPSKEVPLHLTVYRSKDCRAVIHIHSTYAVLWSCLRHENTTDCVPSYTPYLRMKAGSIGVVPYAPPGSAELNSNLHSAVDKSDAWLLANHGMIVHGKTLMDAFAAAEELEESCRIAWELRKCNDCVMI